MVLLRPMNQPNELTGTPEAPQDPVSAERGLDALAMIFSGLCLVHCLALPLLIAILPLAASSLVADERFHQWLLLGVVPTSVLALGWGWRRHHSPLVASAGLIGMSLMTYAAFGGLSVNGERVTTVIGALLVAFGHLRNYQLRFFGHDHAAHAGTHEH